MTPSSLQVSGWLFLGASRPEAFGAIRARYRPWIWVYRIHIFGFLLVVMAAALHRYRPVFDLNAAWMLALGLLAAGVGLRAAR